jgi:hypothetical protein
MLRAALEVCRCGLESRRSAGRKTGKWSGGRRAQR